MCDRRMKSLHQKQKKEALGDTWCVDSNTLVNILLIKKLKVPLKYKQTFYLL